MKKNKRPRNYKKGKWQFAQCSESFTHDEVFEPACLYINCDNMSLKDAKKLSAWLKSAIKWLSKEGK